MRWLGVHLILEYPLAKTAPLWKHKALLGVAFPPDTANQEVMLAAMGGNKYYFMRVVSNNPRCLLVLAKHPDKLVKCLALGDDYGLLH